MSIIRVKQYVQMQKKINKYESNLSNQHFVMYILMNGILFFLYR